MRLTPAKKATHVVIFVVVTVVLTALSMWLGLGPIVVFSGVPDPSPPRDVDRSRAGFAGVIARVHAMSIGRIAVEVKESKK